MKREQSTLSLYVHVHFFNKYINWKCPEWARKLLSECHASNQKKKELIILVVLVSCGQANDMIIKINKQFHKLAVAHYGTYSIPLVIGLSS